MDVELLVLSSHPWLRSCLPALICFGRTNSYNVITAFHDVQECLGLVQAVLKSNGVDLMTARLQAFKEVDEEGQNGVGEMLQCLQNMTEIDPEVPDALAAHAEVVPWLVGRIHSQKFPMFDENKGLAAQLLATLAQVLAATHCHCTQHTNLLDLAQAQLAVRAASAVLCKTCLPYAAEQDLSLGTACFKPALASRLLCPAV